MKVLIDTNIVLDVLAKREPYYKNSAEILKLAETGKLTAFITANSVTDIFLFSESISAIKKFSKIRCEN